MPGSVFVFLKRLYVSTVISVNLGHCLCKVVVGWLIGWLVGWLVSFLCEGLVLLMMVLPTGSHVPIVSKRLVLLFEVDRKLLDDQKKQ